MVIEGIGHQALQIVSSESKTFIWLLLGSIGLSFLLYGNTLGGDFVYDDQLFSKRVDLGQPDSLIKVWTEPFLPQHRDAGLYRPLTVFTFALNFLLFGESPLGFHLVNVFLNGVNVFLVFLLVDKLFNNLFLALVSAAFFGFLPIHTEAVAFIKSRDELLAAFFALLAWLVFLEATRHAKISYLKIFGSSMFFLLAVLAKELIIIAPAAFIAIYWLKNKTGLRRAVKLSLAYLPAASFYLWLRYRVLGQYGFGRDDSYFIINPVGYVDWLTRFWTAFKIAFVYIGKTFVPINLSATYHYNQLTLVENPLTSGAALAGMAFLAILIWFLIWRRTRLTPLAAGAAFFLISYSVISKFVFKAGDILAERWLYFPSIGLSLIGGYGLTKVWGHKKRLTAAVMLAAAAAFGYVIISRNRVWLSNQALYQNMIETAPNSIQGHMNLADLYLENNDLESARRQAETAFNIYKEHPPLLNLIGVIAFKDGNYDLAERAFLKAIEIRPKLPLSFSNIAKVYYKTGDYGKAEEALRNVVNLYPKPEDVILYALTLSKLKRYAESTEVIKKYFSRDLANSQVRLVLAINSFKVGNLDEARKYFDWNQSKSEAEKIEILKDF